MTQRKIRKMMAANRGEIAIRIFCTERVSTDDATRVVLAK